MYTNVELLNTFKPAKKTVLTYLGRHSDAMTQ